MINKKLLAAASVAVAVAASSSAFAKTEGHYAGVNIVRSDSGSQHISEGVNVTNKFNDRGIGAGLDYRYAFNMNNFFIAPGLFVEKNNIKTRGSEDEMTSKISINYRYGLKANIGYDVTDEASVYFTNGLSNTLYKVGFSGVDDGVKFNGEKSTGAIGYFYGAGVAYNVTKEVAVNVEYNTQKIDLNTAFVGAKVENTLSVVKLGVSYHF